MFWCTLFPLIWGNKGKCRTCSLNFASFLSTETQLSFVIRWWYPHTSCQWHEEDFSDSWIKYTRWKVMAILWYWTLHRFDTQTLQYITIMKCISDKSFLGACIFPHAKIPEKQESAHLLQFLILAAQWPSVYKRFYCNEDNSHICFLWPERDSYLIWGNKGKCRTCSLNFASFLSLETQLSFVIRWWYPHTSCQWHEEDFSDSWIKYTRWKVMAILWYWTLHRFDTQTLQSLHLDWWYILHCGYTLVSWVKLTSKGQT